MCCPNAGYYATIGWDPVTGFGVPNYSKMQTYFMSLGNGGSKAPTSAPPHSTYNINFGVTQIINNVIYNDYQNSPTKCNEAIENAVIAVINLTGDEWKMAPSFEM